MDIVGAKVRDGGGKTAVRKETAATSISNVSIKKSLDHKEVSLLQYEFARHKKSKAVMLLLWWFFGWAGVHRLYTKDYDKALALFLLGWATLFIWNVVDVIWASKSLERVNDGIELEIIKAVKAL